MGHGTGLGLGCYRELEKYQEANPFSLNIYTAMASLNTYHLLAWVKSESIMRSGKIKSF